MNEHQVREHVRKLRRFYTDALIYLVVNIGLILIWAISGGGYFWPIWVIIGWGIGLGIHAFSLGLIPQMTAMVPFMTAEWEDQEVRRLMEAGYKGREQAEKKAQKKAEQQATEKVVRADEKVVRADEGTLEKVVMAKPKLKSKMAKAKVKVVKKASVASAKQLEA